MASFTSINDDVMRSKSGKEPPNRITQGHDFEFDNIVFKIFKFINDGKYLNRETFIKKYYKIFY